LKREPGGGASTEKVPIPVPGALYGLAAAALFGMSTPFAKLLVPDTHPLALASLLYLGAAGALTCARRARPRREAPLRFADAPLLAGIIVTGGIVGPVLMLIGLRQVSAVAASLLLNLEAPFTILFAVLLFGEHLGRRAALAAALLVLGATLLAWDAGGVSGEWIGVLAIAAACASWGIDNNLTQRLTLRDPVAIVRWKALGAGGGNLLLAIAIGAPFPATGVVLGALALGALSYGVSILLDVYALRLVGAAREAAYFAAAPFFGAVTAVPLLGEGIGTVESGAALLMITGVALLLRERHQHPHQHDVLTHEHLHVHDEHHRHEHDAGVEPTEPHTHVHTHTPLHHAHPHVPDAHHRHRH
jgi:drug/metabolite transporter (DMT)-like permease